MLQQLASKIDPIYGQIALILMVLAFVLVIVQLFVVKKSEWDKRAQIALDDESDVETLHDHK
ncbi:MAG: hypothetical protein OEM52_00635 [bacterium]|nr:hypothetical protein [bacterium]